ncbi:MAG: SAM-dependent methlyltransferase [Acidimicrobiaceae bacterium]|nr:SAM-dependent methlyltransferase [Acidimicrobiaceae bacterium]
MPYDGRGLKFGTVAENYDLYRPSPPESAKEIAGDLRGLKVLEVGAGTGKLTRFLLDLGAKVSVIEPDGDMRKVLTRHSPTVRVLLGHAESVPAEDASFDAVFSSSAWHWFAQPEATNEVARVLRDNGTLQVWWNGFSRDVPWMVELTKLREREDDANRPPRGWRAQFDSEGPFVDQHDFSIDWTWPRTVDEVVANFATYSGSIIRSEADQIELSQKVRAQLVERFAHGIVELPMTLRGTTARRRPR